MSDSVKGLEHADESKDGQGTLGWYAYEQILMDVKRVQYKNAPEIDIGSIGTRSVNKAGDVRQFQGTLFGVSTTKNGASSCIYSMLIFQIIVRSP